MFRPVLVISCSLSFWLCGQKWANCQALPVEPKTNTKDSASAREENKKPPEDGKKPQTKDSKEPQTETVDMTASELAEAARSAAAREDFATATARLNQLESEYGSNSEVASLLASMQPLRAMCRIRAEDFSGALETIEPALKNPQLDDKSRDELTFWRAVCLLQSGSVEEAQIAFGNYFKNEKHDRRQRYEAFLLFGTGYLQLDDPAGAAEFFGDQIPKLPTDQRDVAGRAAVLYLHALTESGKLKTAVDLVRDFHGRLAEMPQVISFQTLTLALGAKLLEEEKYYDAITCLQRVWPKERLIRHQRQRLEGLAKRREELKAEGNRMAAILQLNSMMTSIERELANFEKVESFDAALRMRLAQGWLGLGRKNEAALLLGEMLGKLPPDEVVRQGALTELRCWLEMERWENAVRSADLYLEKFPSTDSSEDSKDSDTALTAGILEAQFSRAEAFRGSARLAEAEEQFQSIVDSAPKSDFAPRSLFLMAMCQLTRDDNLRALSTLDDLKKAYPENELAEDADYWTGMALFFEKDHLGARDQLMDCIKRHPEGRYVSEAVFSIGHASFNLAEHERATKELRGYLQKYPDSNHAAEARLLLGESLLALGEGEAAIAEFKAVPPNSGRFFDEAWFKAADALRKLDKFEEAQIHLDQYVKEHPASPRIAEAVWQMGKIDQQLKAPEKARKRYWEALDTLANDPTASGVEDLLTALPRLYANSTDQIHLAVELQTRADKATKEGKLAAAVRYGWARGHLQRVIKPEAARAAFVTISHQVKAERDHPRILLDVADAFRESNAPKVATEMYRQMRRWHPRSLERERASLGLALLALQAGNKTEAMTELDRCLRETLTGEVEGAALLEKATLQLEARDFEAVRQGLGKITQSKLMTTEHKARALLLLAKCEAAAGDFKKAGGYYNRGYLSFGKFRELAAESYLGHGQMLEKQNMPDAARKVYEEFLSRKDLASLPLAQRIRQQLANL